MILLTNGCSWTYGGSLGLDEIEKQEQRLQSTWPHHLGQLLNVSENVQLAAGCGSNQRIVRTTFDWLLEQSPERLKDTVAVIQWTEPTRYEYYEPINYNDSLENISNRWARAKVDVVVRVEQRLVNQEDDYTAFERSQRRLETVSHQESMYEMVDRISALGSMFKLFGVRYFYWNQTNHAYQYPERIKDYYCNNFPWLDIPQLHFSDMDNGDRWIYDRVSKIDPHPSFLGHKHLADVIYSRIKDQI